MALYHPSLGYYRSGRDKLGETGDFITAPLISPLFSRCIARQCEQILNACDSGMKRSIVEFGAGDGRMMVDILNCFETDANDFDEYLVVETSADLVRRQKATLRQSGCIHADKVRWAGDYDANICGVVLGNELLDALPVKRFEINAQGVPHELGVCVRDNGFDWAVSNQSLPQPMLDRLSALELEPGYRSELGMQAESWVRMAAEKLHQGGMLLIDYGFPAETYYHRDRRDGTLICHYQHLAEHNPFIHIGEQDMTAHIDFTAIVGAGRKAGMIPHGYTNQADFLISLGILQDYEQQMDFETDPRATLELAQQIKKLTMPHEMGELFKAVSLIRGIECRLTGFERRNQIESVLR